MALDEDGGARETAEAFEEGLPICEPPEGRVDDHTARALELASGQPAELLVGAAAEAVGVRRRTGARGRRDAQEPFAHRVGVKLPQACAVGERGGEARLSSGR